MAVVTGKKEKETVEIDKQFTEKSKESGLDVAVHRQTIRSSGEPRSRLYITVKTEPDSLEIAELSKAESVLDMSKIESGDIVVLLTSDLKDEQEKIDKRKKQKMMSVIGGSRLKDPGTIPVRNLMTKHAAKRNKDYLEARPFGNEGLNTVALEYAKMATQMRLYENNKINIESEWENLDEKGKGKVRRFIEKVRGKSLDKSYDLIADETIGDDDKFGILKSYFQRHISSRLGEEELEALIKTTTREDESSIINGEGRYDIDTSLIKQLIDNLGDTVEANSAKSEFVSTNALLQMITLIMHHLSKKYPRLTYSYTIIRSGEPNLAHIYAQRKDSEEKPFPLTDAGVKDGDLVIDYPNIIYEMHKSVKSTPKPEVSSAPRPFNLADDDDDDDDDEWGEEGEVQF